MLHVDQHQMYAVCGSSYVYMSGSASYVYCVDVCYKWISIGSTLCVDQHLYQGGTVPLSKPVVWLNVNIIINQGSRKGATWAK